MDEIKRGNIYFNSITNLYYVVTGVNTIGGNIFNTIIFDGYETNHKYLGDGTLTVKESEEDYFYQVGGIY